MSEHATCALCELEGHDDVVHLRAVEWKEPVGPRWEAVYRCRDRIACRLRVEASSDPEGRPRAWPLVDSTRDREAWDSRGNTPAPTQASAPVAAAVAVADPPVAPPAPAEPDTWVAPFIDEPEEEFDLWP